MDVIKTIVDFSKTVEYALSTEFPNCSVEIIPVTKNNNIRKTGITVHPKDGFISPTFYMEPYFAMFQSGKPLPEILDLIKKECRATLDNSPININADSINDFSLAKDKICYRLINAGMNKELLSTIPHRSFHDLAVAYYLQHTATPDIGMATITVTDSLAKHWKVDEETLFKLAHQNTKLLNRGIVLTMSDVLDGMTASSVPPEYETTAYDGFDFRKAKTNYLPMHIATNTTKTFGAAVIMYDGLMDAVANKIGSFYALPSSVHEFIIVPDMLWDIEEIKSMVRDINASGVAAEEVLSDSIYHYNSENHELKMI